MWRDFLCQGMDERINVLRGRGSELPTATWELHRVDLDARRQAFWPTAKNRYPTACVWEAEQAGLLVLLWHGEVVGLAETVACLIGLHLVLLRSPLGTLAVRHGPSLYDIRVVGWSRGEDWRRGSYRVGDPLSNEVMEAVWKVGRPVSVREIADELNARRREPLAYTTVMTVMNRLAERHTLTRKRSGKRFLYEPTAPNAAGVAVKKVIRTYGEAAVAPFCFVEGKAREDPAVMRRLRNISRGEMMLSGPG